MYSDGKLKKVEAPNEGDEKRCSLRSRFQHALKQCMFDVCSTLTRLRGTMRLLTELQLAGVFDEAAVLRSVLNDMV
mgnify:CR=1 FL=1